MIHKTNPWIILLGLLVIAPFIQAQEGEEVFELSPFTVDASEEEGYRATTTLAGTRLKTNLEDVGAAISVFTKDLIEDVGATDSETLLTYALNAETGGVQGNFANGVQQDATRTNPQNAQRIRGLSSATLTRNYFTTDIPFDAYNTQSVTVNRGPNSLLFGIGTAGGVIENSLTNATVGGNSGSASIRLGERGSYRTTFDLNRVLLEDRLAVRIASLYEDTDYQQSPAFEEDRRYTISAEGILREGGDSWFGRTTLRGMYEEGEIKSNRPNVAPPVYGFEHWFDDENSLSRQNERWFLDNAEPGSSREHDVTNGQFFWISADPNLGTPKALYDSNRPAEFIKHVAPYDVITDDEIVQGWLSDGSFRDHPDVPAPNPGNQNLGFNSIGTPITLQFFAPLALIAPDHTSGQFGDWDSRGFQGQAGFLLDFKPRGPAMMGAPRTFSTTQHQSQGAGFRVPTMPLEMIDSNRLLISGNANGVKQDFESRDVSLEQILFGGRGGIEFAFHEESYDTESDLTFSPEIGAFGNNRIVGVDLSIWSRDGQVLNPNVGRPLMTDFLNDRRFTEVDRDSYRANAFYELDLTDSDGFLRHFGRSVFSGMILNDERTTRTQQRRLRWGDDVSGGGAEKAAFGNTTVLGGGNREIRSAVYVGPSLLGNEFQTSTDFKITEPINIPRANPGDVFTLQYMPSGSFGFAGTRTADFPVVDTVQWLNANRVEVDSKIAAYQGYFFEEFEHIPNLAVVYGYRDDESKQFLSQNTDPSFSVNNPDGTASLAGGVLMSTPEDPIEGSTETKSAVIHIPDSWNPFSDSVRVSAHWSESENFSPASKRRNIFNESLAPPSGDTRDYGLTLSFVDKFSIRFNWYETEQALTRSAATNSMQAFFTNSGRQAINNLIDDRNDGKPFVGDAAVTTDQGVYTYFVNGILERGGTDPGLIVTTDGAAPNGSPAHVNSTNVDDDASYDNFINALINLLPDATREAVNWRVDPANGLFTETGIPGLTATEGKIAEGFEIDMVGNFTKNWSVLFNVGQQETVINSVAPALSRATDETIANLQANDFWDANFINSVRNALIWRNEYKRVFTGALSGVKAREGQIANEQREWRANLVTNYRFTEGRFKGFNTGGAYRWQGKSAIGYDYDLNTDANVFVPNLNRPIWGPDEENIDLWVGYHRPVKLMSQNMNWRIQLNVRNAFQSDSLIPIGADPDGDLRQFRIPSPTQYLLSNSLSW